MPMASNPSNQRRRIHNHHLGQQHRVPSIEVYSSSPTPPPLPSTTPASRTQVVQQEPSSGGRNNRLSPQLCQSYLPTEFRILSSSHVTRNGGQRARIISNSKSTGNLNIDERTTHGHSSSPAVQHASSFGMLSSRASKSRESNSPSPTSNIRQRRPPHNVSPSRNMTSQRRLISQTSQFLSIDDSLDADEDEDELPKSDNHVSVHSEPPTILGNTIRPGTHETTARRIEIKYCARNDKYKRSTNPTRMKYNGWNSLVYAERNIEWITEHCHDDSGEAVMTYLSRKPGTSSAYIEWRFDFSDIGMKVKRLFLKFPFETFEDGYVRAYVKADSSEDTIPVYSSLVASEVPQMRNWNRFSLIAELSCQRESCAFQHAQLFRQTLKSGFFDKQEDKYQFKIEIELYSMY